MTLGNNIQKIRKEANLSQEELAEQLSVTRQTISNWENSKSYPDLETLIKISDSFGISLDILLKEDLTMVKTIDTEVKSTRKYARVLIIIGIIIAVLIGSFCVYSAVYLNRKNKLETNFKEQIEVNGFYKNRDGYFSMEYEDGVVFGVPNQSMPRITDFTLNFHSTDLYCNIDMKDSLVNITWYDTDSFFASAESKDGKMIIGSTSKFDQEDLHDMKKLSSTLGVPEDELKDIINKGNELYKDFYPEQ